MDELVGGVAGILRVSNLEFGEYVKGHFYQKR